jgi:4-alpha-glucanotransferase
VVPFDPERLRAVGYEPFRQTLRAVLRPASGLRVDHVMGLFRLFWVAAGEGPGAGTYVRYPADDLLAVLAEESRRVEAFVVGEDLGTVEDGVRAELAARAVLSYRLLWFEDEPPPAYPRQALAAVTTHDLPTVAGLWTGADLAAQRRLGLAPAEESMARMRARVRDGLGLADDAPVGEVVQRVYEWLATAPSMLVSATLEDALEVVERPNMPGTTTDQWPNWSLALPMPLEDLVRDYRPRAIATAFRRRSEREGASTQ